MNRKFADLIELLSKKHMHFKMRELEKIGFLNVSLNHFQYINIICELDNPTLSDIAAKMKVSNPAITMVINKLIAQNIVYKERSEMDGRVFHICLTEKGEKISKAYKKSYEEFVKYVTRNLSDEEQEQVIYLLDKMV